MRPKSQILLPQFQKGNQGVSVLVPKRSVITPRISKEGHKHESDDQHLEILNKKFVEVTNQREKTTQQAASVERVVRKSIKP